MTLWSNPIFYPLVLGTESQGAVVEIPGNGTPLLDKLHHIVFYFSRHAVLFSGDSTCRPQLVWAIGNFCPALSYVVGKLLKMMQKQGTATSLLAA